MSGAQSWMLYGAAGYTGALIAQHARKRGHQPMLAGRNAAAVAALAERLDLPHRAVTLDDPAALSAALDGVELVLNAAGPFVRTAAPLAEACLAAGAHYIDIGNELQVFRTLYDLDQRAQRAGVTIMPGVGFGVVATNCLARYVSDAVGGAQHLEVAARAAAARQGPGIAASVRENLPYGGWTRQAGRLHPCPLGSGITAIPLPDGPCRVMPFPTGDLEAAFQATGAPDVTAYSPVPADPAALDPQAPDPEAAGPPIYRSFGWARATGPDGDAQAWLQTGESYAFTAAASIRAVEETLTRSLRGAFSPAAAFGADFALTIPDTGHRGEAPDTGLRCGHVRGSRAGGSGRLLRSDRRAGQKPRFGPGHRRSADRGNRCLLRSHRRSPGLPQPRRRRHGTHDKRRGRAVPGDNLQFRVRPWVRIRLFHRHLRCTAAHGDGPLAKPGRSALAGGPVLRRPGSRPAADILRSGRHPVHAAIRGRDGPAGSPDLAGSRPASQPAATGAGQRTRVTAFKGVPASCSTASPAPRSFSLPDCSNFASILHRPGARRGRMPRSRASTDARATTC